MSAVVSRVDYSITDHVFSGTSHTADAAKRLLADFRGLAADIAARAVEIEAGRRIPLDPVKALRSIGVFRTFVPHCVPAVKKVYSAIGRRRFAVMAVGAGFFAISVSSFAADLGTGYSTAIAVPPQAAPAGRRPLPAHPIDPPDARPDRSMQHGRTVDQLYEELMRSSGCFLGSNNASIGGGC
jgi:hypothetical protein